MAEWVTNTPNPNPVSCRERERGGCERVDPVPSVDKQKLQNDAAESGLYGFVTNLFILKRIQFILINSLSLMQPRKFRYNRRAASSVICSRWG